MPDMISTAIVLAAGLGTRMRPLTDTTPKPLVEVAGVALIDHVLERLAQAGVSRAIVNVHYLADQIEAHVAGRAQPQVAISDERDLLLDTGGGAKRAMAKIGDHPALIHNSDSIWLEGMGMNLERLMAAFDPAKMDCLLLLAPTARSIGYGGAGDFIMGGDGVLHRRPEREMAPFVFAGVSIASPRLFDDSPEGAFSLNMLWDRAIDEGRLFGMVLDGIWMHVGTPEAITEAEELIANAHEPSLLADPPGRIFTKTPGISANDRA